MKFLEPLVRWCEAVTAKPIEEATWLKWRRRAAVGTMILGLILAAQTALVHNPSFLINAIYHSRQAHFIQIQAMPPEKRTRLLQRLCLQWKYFAKGEIDPYQIPDYHECMSLEAK
ncbi:MAG: hypothetical protein EXQ86_02365 [Rhodospirillales bacterium]|nr:hypothetical protein [Rhodospirillales bacterium]